MTQPLYSFSDLFEKLLPAFLMRRVGVNDDTVPIKDETA